MQSFFKSEDGWVSSSQLILLISSKPRKIVTFKEHHHHDENEGEEEEEEDDKNIINIKKKKKYSKIDIEKALNLIKQHCLKYLDSKHINIKTLFRKFDRNDDKSITIDEFEKFIIDQL